MTTLAAKFNQGAAKYQEWRTTPWGRLRTEMIWQQLQWHLSDSDLQVLDVGCGLGDLAIRLAQAGHQVTAMDFSAEMLMAAKRDALAAGVNVDWLHGSVEAASTLLQDPFDMILCHSVLAYVDSPAKVVDDLAARLAINGTLSLVVANPASLPLITAVREGDFAAALEKLESPAKVSGTFDLDLQLYSAETVTGWLETAGLSISAHYGIRSINDLISDNQIKYDPEQFAVLLQLEMALCQQSPYREIAAFSHLLAQRN
jgi:S-adenosylmethionine-dependent methyltransferase